MKSLAFEESESALFCITQSLILKAIPQMAGKKAAHSMERL
jgi:hypothetical protein